MCLLALGSHWRQRVCSMPGRATPPAQRQGSGRRAWGTWCTTRARAERLGLIGMRAKEKKIGATPAEVDGSSPAVVLELPRSYFPRSAELRELQALQAGAWKLSCGSEHTCMRPNQSWVIFPRLGCARPKAGSASCVFSALLFRQYAGEREYFPRFPGTPKGQPR